MFSTNVNLLQTTKNKGWDNKTILVGLQKLVERRGVHFDVSSKMRDFTRPIICLLETQSLTRNGNLKLVFFWLPEIFDFFVPGGSAF